GDVPAADAFAIADRIHCGVRAIAAVAAGVYVDTEPGHAPEEAGERFDSFARTIAHELKNPLGAARGAAELLATGEGTETPESRTRFAELVIRNVNKALDVLDDVRATSQVDARSDVA
ncbi:MAG TPA: histidine kinase dimerization/phospho-acceptor domain-containing protein, partial [Longimicrobiales bacterium]|nr:histidine kinase dimerization/phospho-acceptor domain-containing protein [Longimicrobiales bacterium]